MYKLLLCTRYLRTRYIALASIISVTLGVATMIVVNSVMAGFSTQMRDRIHGLLADVIVESRAMDGAPDSEVLFDMARQAVGDEIDGMAATVEVFGIMHLDYAGQSVAQPVTLIGIKPEEKATVGPLVDYLASYNPVIEDDIVVKQALRDRSEPPGWELTDEAIDYRKSKAEKQAWFENRKYHGGTAGPQQVATGVADPFKTDPFKDGSSGSQADASRNNDQLEVGTNSTEPEDSRPGLILPVGAQQPGGTEPSAVADGGSPDFDGFGETDPSTLPPEFVDVVKPFEPIDFSVPLDGRCYIGQQLISYPYEDRETGKMKTMLMRRPGDDVQFTSATASRSPTACSFNATIVDVFKSGMSEYDSNLVFCNLEQLQKVRGMIDPQTGKGSVTALQIKLKDFDKADEVVRRLKSMFPPGVYNVRTWEQKQGPLLAAVEVESMILNILLFLIIAVAGFGILAIFYMIVVEKTRDIGILKALGANAHGIMSIFLSYGLGLGLVGSGVGTGLGLLFVYYINEISDLITLVTGRDVFPETIYYFPEIPTHVSPIMVFWVSVGAISIAVLASILPARRAAALKPVEALRYE
ncbi:ABC transporter permease [Stratiformator vulcanicus]|uniref:Lipoprotein-releasing system transmembrane protein LolC n=1 Tax=Stratiformator vulcanicus TaxID=2527980 RepID=A0A517R3P7_9PLAN|nr:FtsX-like permease family protein [Stratiformator vulcanicus]QDT38477.1 Lipoprotein-releasing system transmembrane protein LolC [Stratiformator vulcanicus]